LLLNKKSEYAIFLLSHLASSDSSTPIPAKKIAEIRDIPVNIIPQITAVLSKKGWIKGIRGAGGGVILEADPEEITLKEVIEAVHGPMAINPCVLENQTCSGGSRCALQNVLKKAHEEMIKIFDQVTIKELADDIDKN